MTQWWQAGTIYQIYPRSFQDSDGDGVGDLEGIRRRLPYLADLGVDAIWLSPIFPSPMADFGYDVADYNGVHPLFGTMADFDRLLADAHAHGLKLLLDLVPNHSSDRHPWFEESRASRESAKRDWYIWRDPAPGGGPPNNWMSYFGGSAWEWDAATGQYYLHLFLKEQPDLNWRNPAVADAIFDAMRFWFAKGVDGFRIDVLWLLIKGAQFRDNPPNPHWRPGMPDIDRLIPLHSADQPGILDVVAAMRRVAKEFGDRLLIGEIYLPLPKLMTYYGADGSGVQLPFNFQLLQTPWQAEAIGALIRDYEAALPDGGWPNWVLGNHDRARIAARIGEAQARVAAMLLLTLRGTPTLYYGDELGMTGAPIPPGRIRDPQKLREPHNFNRDEARTPMAWTAAPEAGFTEGEPWLPLDPDASVRNVARQAADPTSMLALTRALLALRRGERALQTGAWRALPAAGPVLAYERLGEDSRLAIFLNLSDQPASLTVPDAYAGAPVLFAARDGAPERLTAPFVLPGDQGLIARGA